MEFQAVIETPMGSRNKYEVDPETGAIYLDRLLFTATRYPTGYGFALETVAEDGDPSDVLVLVEEATFPGCGIRVRPVGLFLMHDEHGGGRQSALRTGHRPAVATDPRHHGHRPAPPPGDSPLLRRLQRVVQHGLEDVTAFEEASDS
jgi:inorganic pyrophosphatase